MTLQRNIFLVATMLVPLSGCATAMRGTSEQLQLYSTPDGATAALQDGQTCTTPCDLKIQRGKPYNVTFTKNGCASQTQLVSPTVAGSGVAESLVVGGVIDWADGAVYDSQPNPLSVTLNCKSASAQAPSAGTRTASAGDGGKEHVGK